MAVVMRCILLPHLIIDIVKMAGVDVDDGWWDAVIRLENGIILILLHPFWDCESLLRVPEGELLN